KVDAEIGIALAIQQTLFERVCFDSAQRFHPRILRMTAAAHLLDDQERTEVVEISLAASGGTSCPDRTVNVQPGAQNRRITHAPRDFPGQSAGGGDAADLALCIDAVAVDGAVVVFPIDQTFRHHLLSRAAPDLCTCLRIE